MEIVLLRSESPTRFRNVLKPDLTSRVFLRPQYPIVWRIQAFSAVKSLNVPFPAILTRRLSSCQRRNVAYIALIKLNPVNPTKTKANETERNGKVLWLMTTEKYWSECLLKAGKGGPVLSYVSGTISAFAHAITARRTMINRLTIRFSRLTGRNHRCLLIHCLSQRISQCQLKSDFFLPEHRTQHHLFV